MTDRQVRTILYHKRDKNGILTAPVVLPGSPRGKVPKAAKFPASLEEELRQILPLASWLGAQKYDEMVATIKERWKSGTRNGGTR